ncbi:MAG: restriction endonuclease subunit S [Bacteroidales bacterium]
MPFGLKDTDYKLIKNVFQQFPKIHEVIVFGSRAMGTEKPGSDVDLALKGSDIKLDDILKLKHKLEELPIIYDFDIINYATINTPALVEHIDRHGIQFYKKQETPNEWKTYKLGDVLEIKYGKDHKHLADGNIPLYGSGGIMRYVETALYDKESILIPRKGTLSNLFYLDKPFWSVDTMFYTKIKDGNNGKYLYYLLKSMDLASMNVGSAVPSLTTEVLNKVGINVPDESTQKEIAQILTSLDDKIELNLQMNQTLEAMAQAIFKEWFVDFNFPGFDGQLVNGLPKGWKKEALDEKISFLNGLALQKFPPKSEVEYLPVIKIRELKQGVSESSDKASTEIDIKYIIEDGDILFSWSGSLEVVMWCNGKGALNQHLFKVSSDNYPKWFYYYWVKEYLAIFQATAADKATTMGHIQRRHLTESLINIPDKDTLKNANAILEPILERIKLNAVQIQILTQTRDALLPKLMSGQIAVV